MHYRSCPKPRSTVSNCIQLLGLAICLTALLPVAIGQSAITPQSEAHRLATDKGLIISDSSPARAFELQHFVNGVPMYYRTTNLDAADSVGTDELWPGGSSGFGLTGSGVTLAVWDGGGVRLTHDEFGGRVSKGDGWSSTHWHSTHVGGTMIAAGVWGGNSTYPAGQSKGMSPSATLVSYEWNNDDSEMDAAGAAGLLVSNHSYGYITGWVYDNFGPGTGWYWFGDVTVSTVEDFYFGFYSYQSRNWDEIACDHLDYLIVTSAGNDRDEGPSSGTGHWYWDDDDWSWSTATRNLDGNSGYDCLSHQAVSKNGLAVGAVYDVIGGYSSPGGVSMTTFSCWGPTDDGRIKPDIVGNGYELVSAYDAYDSAYAIASGTSMASPNVSGSLGLFIKHWRDTHSGDGDMRSATLKGLILHTADECGSSAGPDYRYGWGLLDSEQTAAVISEDVSEPLTISEQTLADGETFEIYATTDGSSSELRATICWTDPEGSPPSDSVDPPDLMLVNDLDLRIIADGSGTTSYPWRLNPASPTSAATTGDNFRDNVEQVALGSPGSGSYTIRVTHKGSLAGGSQAFSLIITGAASLTTDSTQYTLTVNTVGQGSVDLDPPGGTYPSGTSVDLTANADPGWYFDHWQGALSGSANPETLVMDADYSVTAVFEQYQYTLTVNVSGSGSVDLDPPGGTYPSGTSVDLTANADPGWYFDHWQGALSGSANPETLVMDADYSVTAVFVQYQYTLTVNVSGNGSVDLDPPGGTYPSGTSVDLTANADPGWYFDHWQGALSGSANPETLVMDADYSVTAVFEQYQYTLTVNVSGNGSVDLDPPGGTYPSGTSVDLTADADPGWYFDHWEGALTGSANPETLVMDADYSVTAVFERECFADINNDGVVDLSDLAQLLANYGITSGAQYEDGDVDGDGDVDLGDLASLLAVYGTVCE